MSSLLCKSLFNFLFAENSLAHTRFRCMLDKILAKFRASVERPDLEPTKFAVERVTSLLHADSKRSVFVLFVKTKKVMSSF